MNLLKLSWGYGFTYGCDGYAYHLPWYAFINLSKISYPFYQIFSKYLTAELKLQISAPCAPKFWTNPSISTEIFFCFGGFLNKHGIPIADEYQNKLKHIRVICQGTDRHRIRFLKEFKNQSLSGSFVNFTVKYSAPGADDDVELRFVLFFGLSSSSRATRPAEISNRFLKLHTCI